MHDHIIQPANQLIRSDISVYDRYKLTFTDHLETKNKTHQPPINLKHGDELD